MSSKRPTSWKATQEVPFYWSEKVMIGACDDLYLGYRLLYKAIKTTADTSRKEKWPGPRWKPEILRELLEDTKRGYDTMLQVIAHLEGRFGEWSWPDDQPSAARCSGIKVNGKPCCAARRQGTPFCRHHQDQAATATAMADLVAEMARTLGGNDA